MASSLNTIYKTEDKGKYVIPNGRTLYIDDNDNDLRDVLNYHSTIGWSLAGVLSVISGWRYVSRQTNPQVLSKGFVFVDIVLAVLVCTQVYLGDMLVWIYGLHTVPVVEAVREGIL